MPRPTRIERDGATLGELSFWRFYQNAPEHQRRGLLAAFEQKEKELMALIAQEG